MLRQWLHHGVWFCTTVATMSVLVAHCLCHYLIIVFHSEFSKMAVQLCHCYTVAFYLYLTQNTIHHPHSTKALLRGLSFPFDASRTPGLGPSCHTFDDHFKFGFSWYCVFFSSAAKPFLPAHSLHVYSLFPLSHLFSLESIDWLV